jgi:hypothetical protein
MNWVTKEKVLQGVKEVKEGLTFVLSLPLDYPGGNCLNPRRHPPRLAATHRNGRQNFAYEVRQDNPMQTDVVCDDLVLLTLQYSTQWDSFAHVGSLFDADGDGTAEPVFYNGFRAGEHIKPAPANPKPESWNLYEGHARRGARHPEPRRARRARARRDDRPACALRQEAACGGFSGIERNIGKDKVTVETGDIVCLHTALPRC